jgi:hypothetical protein
MSELNDKKIMDTLDKLKELTTKRNEVMNSMVSTLSLTDEGVEPIEVMNELTAQAKCDIYYELENLINAYSRQFELLGGLDEYNEPVERGKILQEGEEGADPALED